MSDLGARGPLRVVVVDDEAPAREWLLHLMAGDDEVSVVGVCDGGQSAITAIRETRPDLVLLDIQMPEVEGFDVIKAIGEEQMPLVIFVSAYQERVLEAVVGG